MLQSGSTIAFLDKIKSNFHFAFQPTFNTKKPPILENYILTVLSKDCKIWITNPALFFFVTCDVLTPLTTSPERIKVIKSLICNLPILDFEHPNEEFDYIFCITDFILNRNLSTDGEIRAELEKLKIMQTSLAVFFSYNG